MENILNYIDLIWIPIVFFAVGKRHRFYAVGFVIACAFMLRMQYELLEEWGFGEEGFPNMLLDSNPFIRGIITYSVFNGLFTVLSLYSKKTDPIIYMAAAISIFFMAFIISSIVMCL